MSAPGAAPNPGPVPGPGSSPDELPIDVELIKVLASDSRRDILRMLGERRKTLTELAEALGLKKATVLEHLQKLVEAGLIRKLDEGERLWIYYELTPRGKRLVRPERTRFYLILAGSAVALVLLGIAVAASVMLNGAPSQLKSYETGDDLASAPSFEAVEGYASQVAWRGLDERIDLRVPEAGDNATLLLRSADGATHALDVSDHVAILDAMKLDALAAGDYALSLSANGSEAPLPQTLRVRDAPIAVFPSILPEGANATLEVVLAPPGYAPPANATIRIGDAETRYASQGVAFVPVNASGATEVDVGRLFRTTVLTVPAFDLGLANDNGSLALLVQERGSPIAGAELALDGASLGATNESGSLVVPWPSEGDHALRIRAADGRTLETAIRVAAGSASEAPLMVRIDAIDARLPGVAGMRLRADVFNDGAAEALVTVAAREGDALLASTLARIPAHGRVEVLLESALATPQVVDVTAHSARTSVVLQDGWDGSWNAGNWSGSATADESAPPAAAAPAPAAGAQAPQTTTSADNDARAYYSQKTTLSSASTSGVVARDTIVLASAFAPGDEVQEPAGASAPKAPGPGALLLVAIVAVAALALRGRRRG